MGLLTRSGGAILQQIGNHFAWIIYITLNITKMKIEVLSWHFHTTNISDFVAICGDLQGNPPDKAIQISCRTI
jgi:hypothetical protein